jgi:hypothetical protein
MEGNSARPSAIGAAPRYFATTLPGLGGLLAEELGGRRVSSFALRSVWAMTVAPTSCCSSHDAALYLPTSRFASPRISLWSWAMRKEPAPHTGSPVP